MKSHSSTKVTDGTSRWVRVTCSTIRRRTPRTGMRVPSAAPARVARTSSSVIRPPRPLPRTASRSTPSSLGEPAHGRGGTNRGRRLVADDGHDGLGAVAAACGGSVSTERSSCSPSSPTTTSTAPTGATSPSATTIFSTVPAYGDGISTVVLSVWISTRGWSSSIRSPSATSQRATSPSVRPSPRSGSRNSCRHAAREP